MHQYKPLLKIAHQTIIEHTIYSLKYSLKYSLNKCKINDIIVVTGHNREKITPVILQAGARPVFNKNFKTGGMLSSIKTGVQALCPQASGFLLLPVDIPLIRPATIQSLISVFIKNYKHIIIPQFNGEPGHPPVIPAWLIPEILNLKNHSNLGTLLLSLKKHQKRQIVYDQGILMDADTKEDYEHLKEEYKSGKYKSGRCKYRKYKSEKYKSGKYKSRKYKSMDIPNKKECQSIINANIDGQEKIKAHVKLVAKTAITLAKAVQIRTVQIKTDQIRAVQVKLNKEPVNNTDLDIDLIYAGALLHDIKRKETDHAKKGAQYLLSIGFAKIADIVAQHMDLTLPLSDNLTEAQIVYFADKLCNDCQLEPDLDYSKRFQNKIKQTPHAGNIILKRYEHTKLIQARIEKVSGRSVKSILHQL